VCMEEITKRRQHLLENLARHAKAARVRLCLDFVGAARLLRTDPSILAGIEQGVDSDMSIEAVIDLARGLGLTDQGLPRPKPSGSL
jgi:hypothetical protein